MRIWRDVTRAVCVSLFLALSGAPAASGQGTDGQGTVSRVRAHLEFLAHDLMEGRATGTRGYDLAANYVAAVLRTYGFEPAGANGTFFQPVPLRTSKAVTAALTLRPKGGSAMPLELPADAIVVPSVRDTSTEVAAALVYAGYGVTAPELNYDDYSGIDVRGKIVLIFTNAPAQFPSEPRAHYSAIEEKLRNAARRGAVGVVAASTPEDLKRLPWEVLAGYLSRPAMNWLDAQGKPANDVPEIRAGAVLSPAGVAKVFRHSPTPLESVYAAAEKGAPKGFEFPLTVTIAATNEHGTARSANVAGILRGSDPHLASTYVVLTAHLDHEGIGPAVDGDSIYNGAYDNALGCAILLEVSRTIAQSPQRPLRSILVVFVTAEEKRLLGSDYFARNPTVPRASLVANVNLDMPLLQWPLSEVVAFGAENSSLGKIAEATMPEAGLRLAPDPIPQENLFIRSDQYSFVKQGVPAVFLIPGFRSSDPSKNPTEMFGRFLATHYHKPTDDTSLPMDGSAVAAFVRANYLLTLAIANERIAPTWNAGNFFGERFGRR